MENTADRQNDAGDRKLGEMYRSDNVFSISVPDTLSFFKWWCIFRRPFIPLTDREIDVVAGLLRQRWELSKSIQDDAILDAMVMSRDILNKVAEECKMAKPHFYVVMNALKKKGVVTNHIAPKLIPNLKSGREFKLTILFKKED